LRIVRFNHANMIKYGVIENDIIRVILDNIFEEIVFTDENLSFDSVNLLSPVLPSKIVCIGKNYKDHILELGGDIPPEPIIFLKPPTSLIGPSEKIKYPPIAERVDFEGELALVIKKTCRNIPQENVQSVIFGYTCANDITARDLQKKDGQWTRSKSFDTFCPIGPWIETDLDPNNLKIQTYLNSELKQSSNTSLMITPVFELVEFISKVMTLHPGDVILTGTPEGIGSMQIGDRVEVVIEKIGKLENFVS